MKNLLYLSALGMFMLSCTDLNSLEPYQKDTFVKYFGDPGSTLGVDLEVNSDSYAILAHNVLGTTNSARLFTTDLLGNNLQAAPANDAWNDFIPSDLHATGSGYLVIGDYVNSGTGNNVLRLVTTDASLNVTNTFEIDSAGIDAFGRAVTLSSQSEIIISGYYKSTGGDYSFVAGLDNSLTPVWFSQHAATENSFETARSIYQDDDQGTSFLAIQFSEINSLSAELRPLIFRNDGSIPDARDPLSDPGLIGTTGDFIQTNSAGGYVFAFSLQTSEGSRIELVNADLNSNTRNAIKPDEADYFAHSLTNIVNSDEVVILGSKSVTNTDTDLFITRVEKLDGSLNADSGFAITFGGTGKESGAAIKQAPDGGFVILGNLENTNESQVLILMKVNEKGELVN